MDRETFEVIKRKHGGYASWAIWADATGTPKSNIGDLSVLDPDENPTLLETLRNDVMMVGLNLSRLLLTPFGNFHDPRPAAQDYKVRFAFTGTLYYGAYMTDLVKGVVEAVSSNLLNRIGSDPSLIRGSVHTLLEEFEDLQCASPMIIIFGARAYQLVSKHVPSAHYSRLVKVTHYSHFISKEEYRDRVLAELAA